MTKRHSKAGKRADLGGLYVRSSWEANVARILNWMKANDNIKDWEYEPDTFWFEGIKRGTRSYTPDFKITENDDSIVYWEVKGWMDAKSKTQLKRMKKYHPDVKIIVIDSRCYNGFKKWRRLIPHWEG